MNQPHMHRGRITTYHTASHTASLILVRQPQTQMSQVPVVRQVQALAAGDDVAALVWPDGRAVVMGAWGGTPESAHNADTVDGYHAASAPAANTLLATDAAGHLPAHRVSGTLRSAWGASWSDNGPLLQNMLHTLAGQHIFVECWKNLDGWTQAGTGSVTVSPARLSLYSGSGPGSSHRLYTAAVFDARSPGSPLGHGFTFRTDHPANSEYWLTLLQGADAMATGRENHVGFYITDSTLYASNGDGTSGISTALCAVTSGAVYNLAILTQNTGYTYYVNGAQKAHHSTCLGAVSWNHRIVLQAATTDSTERMMRVRSVRHVEPLGQEVP